MIPWEKMVVSEGTFILSCLDQWWAVVGNGRRRWAVEAERTSVSPTLPLPLIRRSLVNKIISGFGVCGRTFGVAPRARVED